MKVGNDGAAGQDLGILKLVNKADVHDQHGLSDEGGVVEAHDDADSNLKHLYSSH